MTCSHRTLSDDVARSLDCSLTKLTARAQFIPHSLSSPRADLPSPTSSVDREGFATRGRSIDQGMSVATGPDSNSCFAQIINERARMENSKLRGADGDSEDISSPTTSTPGPRTEGGDTPSALKEKK